MGNFRVKVQDHTNLNRTLLQFCIYCLIMCDNRDIYPTIETALIFSDASDSKNRSIYGIVGKDSWSNKERNNLHWQVMGTLNDELNYPYNI